MSQPVIVTDGAFGWCPVQSEGTIDGFPFYFRARGQHWKICIANGANKDPVDVSCGFAEGWVHEEEYGNEPFAAGYMTEGEAMEFISKAAQLFHSEGNGE